MGKVDKVNSSEVQRTLKSFKINKANGTGNLNTELFKYELHSLKGKFVPVLN
jgi:hypothetical protein